MIEQSYWTKNELKNFSGSEVKFILCILSLSPEGGGTTVPLSRLSEISGLSQPCTIKVIKQLEAKNKLAVERKLKSTSTYHLMLQ